MCTNSHSIQLPETFLQQQNVPICIEICDRKMSVASSDSPTTVQFNTFKCTGSVTAFDSPEFFPIRKSFPLEYCFAISVFAPSRRQRSIQTDIFHGGFFLDRLLEFPLLCFYFSCESLCFHRPAGDLLRRPVSCPSSKFSSKQFLSRKPLPVSMRVDSLLIQFCLASMCFAVFFGPLSFFWCFSNSFSRTLLPTKIGSSLPIPASVFRDCNLLLDRGLRHFRIVVRDTRTVSAFRTTPTAPSAALLAEPFDLGAYL